MKLEKLILVNWGFVVSREYLFGDTTLLSGPTGVGKSSFQDAIQLVMTGAKQHINVFNSAQDEAGGGGRAGHLARVCGAARRRMPERHCHSPTCSAWLSHRLGRRAGDLRYAPGHYAHGSD